MRKKVILSVVAVIVLLGLGIIFDQRQKIVFKDDFVEVNIHSEINPMDYIQEIKGCDDEDIKIDVSELQLDQLGEYKIYYQVNDKEYSLNVRSVDSNPPTFETVDLDVDLGTDISCEQMVKNIDDETETRVSFKEKYDFSKVGNYEVVIVVEDEAGNKTEKNAQVKVVKDEEKPTLTGLNQMFVYVNGSVDYLKGVTAKDNRDKDPQIHVDDSQVDLTKAGTYTIKYTVKDRSGNSQEYTRKIIVKEKTPISIPADGSKIVYLTFDDGPSSNTAKILDILSQYNCHVTFFVTGNGQKYNYLIKRVYNEGHTIGLHTYTHQYQDIYTSTDAYYKDLTQIGNMVKEQIGFVPKYIRFPGGSSNQVSASYCKGIMSILVNEVQERGYQYYDWNVNSGDADELSVSASTIVKNSTSSSADNIMILMHDIDAKKTTVEALPKVIEYYQAKGYIFKGIDDSSFTPHYNVAN